MLHISLFSGMGGFDLASHWMGWTNIVSCEINPFGNRLLEFYWPKAYHHNDIHTLTYEKINQELTARFGHNWRSDDIILTGGFPCQPYSMAGKRLGKEDERHLWPEMLRTIKEIKPRWVVGENVRGLLNWNGGLVFDEVCSDLESLGYQVTAGLIPACATDAPHKRERIWIIAYNNSEFWGEGREHKSGKQSRYRESISEISRQGSTPNTSSDGCEDGRSETIGKKRGSQQGRVQQPKGMGGERSTTNTDTTGCEDRTKQHWGQSTSNGERLDSIGGHSIGTTTNTHDNGRAPQGEGSQTEGIRGENNGKSEEWSEPTERTDGLPRLQRDAPNTDRKRLKKQRKLPVGNAEREFERGICTGDAPNTDSIRCDRRGDEVNPNDRRVDALGDVNKSNWDAPKNWFILRLKITARQ